jgi:hypothetical protein
MFTERGECNPQAQPTDTENKERLPSPQHTAGQAPSCKSEERRGHKEVQPCSLPLLLTASKGSGKSSVGYEDGPGTWPA